ncbi:uncharacterized protein BDR25DRAFT_2990 [Lindgomyces ingoldianus]|uniref:Uncharacterized protein n=1 Tax=Lindgomyces ingoldianus TaxID=673940 RepID=A0ACB6RG36_9PLEO|nr:uncharacterized protein BDR25DRAFT_2990 [Lindgomyces ingoldianus]KAF2477685.1 hypothetical protein BDR25DRAFT_2990 [Lindgomyces ingoldianus]
MASTTLLGLSLTLTPPLLTLLRLSPLLSSTASLTHAYMELVTTSSFLAAAPTTSALTTTITKNPATPTSTLSAASGAALESAKDLAIPAWFTNFFNRALWSVIGFNTITTCTAAANLFLFPLSQTSAPDTLFAPKNLYAAGLVFAIGHYVGVPLVAPSVEALMKMCVEQEKGGKEVMEAKKEKGKARELLAQWVGVHKVRMGTVDLWAWCCFTIGAVGALS